MKLRKKFRVEVLVHEIIENQTGPFKVENEVEFVTGGEVDIIFGVLELFKEDIYNSVEFLVRERMRAALLSIAEVIKPELVKALKDI